jgi:hypothetical protein
MYSNCLILVYFLSKEKKTKPTPSNSDLKGAAQARSRALQLVSQ